MNGGRSTEIKIKKSNIQIKLFFHLLIVSEKSPTTPHKAFYLSSIAYDEKKEMYRLQRSVYNIEQLERLRKRV
jgi:hypothetical protein